MPAQVIVRDLRKAYGATRAVDGINLEVARGTIFGLLGPNGAGKTTTVECIIGLREPDEGYIEVCGIDVRREPREMKQRIGVALQATALQEAITPREAIELLGAFYRQREDTADLLRRFDLRAKADARFATLSGGEKQRLALALAFVNRPELVVLDEPTAGLDTQARRELRAEIRKMQSEGCTVLLTTHDLAEAEELCDQVAIIDHGRILARGEPGSLLGEMSRTQVVILATDRVIDVAGWPARCGITDIAIEGTRAMFHTTDATTALGELAVVLRGQGIRLISLTVDQPSLEDAFLQLTRRTDRAGAGEGRR
ncbi:MAG: ABC transporter ATP-binding protein [Verrucomicrobia bacterium]|nr:ABC transporter ATP-binding protein [Verrucomicrobiota bacterium]